MIAAIGVIIAGVTVAVAVTEAADEPTAAAGTTLAGACAVVAAGEAAFWTAGSGEVGVDDDRDVLSAFEEAAVSPVTDDAGTASAGELTISGADPIGAVGASSCMAAAAAVAS